MPGSPALAQSRSRIRRHAHSHRQRDSEWIRDPIGNFKGWPQEMTAQLAARAPSIPALVQRRIVLAGSLLT